MSYRKYELKRQELNIATGTTSTFRTVRDGNSMKEFNHQAGEQTCSAHSQVNVFPAFDIELTLPQ